MRPSARQIRRQLLRGGRTLNLCQTKRSRNKTRDNSIQDFLQAIKNKDETGTKSDNPIAKVWNQLSATGAIRARGRIAPMSAFFSKAALSDFIGLDDGLPLPISIFRGFIVSR